MLLRTVGRGQEFVLDTTNYAEVLDWGRRLFYARARHLLDISQLEPGVWPALTMRATNLIHSYFLTSFRTLPFCQKPISTNFING